MGERSSLEGPLPLIRFGSHASGIWIGFMDLGFISEDLDCTGRSGGSRVPPAARSFGVGLAIMIRSAFIIGILTNAMIV